MVENKRNINMPLKKKEMNKQLLSAKFKILICIGYLSDLPPAWIWHKVIYRGGPRTNRESCAAVTQMLHTVDIP